MEVKKYCFSYQAKITNKCHKYLQTDVFMYLVQPKVIPNKIISHSWFGCYCRSSRNCSSGHSSSGSGCSSEDKYVCFTAYLRFSHSFTHSDLTFEV